MERALVNADKAGDTDAARKLAAAILSARKNGGVYSPGGALEPSMTDRIKAVPAQIVEAITGEQRTTQETDELGDWATMPELNSFSVASAKTGLGTLLSNPKETVQVIQANFPGVQARQDDKGNFLLRSSIDGKEYAIKPGFSFSDIPRALAGVAAFTPAGRATTLTGMAAAGAGTQAAIEATQAATGGEFNPGDVAIAGALPPVIGAAGRVAAPIKQAISRIAGRTPNAKAPPASTAPAAPKPEAAAQTVPPGAQPNPLTPDELGATMRTAALGGLGSKKATQKLAAEAAPDADTVAAAERLGILNHLQPDHVTTNQAYRQLAQLVKSQTGSEAAMAQHAGLEKVAERASQIIDEIGGTVDVSSLEATLRAGMQSVERDLKSKADELYAQVRDAIPATTSAPAPSTAALIRQRADDLCGEKYLTPLEQRVLSIVDDPASPPTYARLDDLRKRLNAAKYGKAEEAFTSADDALRDRVLTALRSDQESVAQTVGQGETWNLAQATAATYKGVQNDTKAIFGKQLDKSMAPLLSGSVKKLSQGDTAAFVRLLKATPPEMRQEVAASGLSSFFLRTARGGEMDFAGYAKWHEGLQRNKQAYAALMSNLPPDTVRQLGDLARVARGVALAKGEFLSTGKAINPKVLQAADSMMVRVFEEVKRRGAAGLAAEVAGSASGAPGLASALMSATSRNKPSIMQAADKLIASPEFIAAAQAAGTSGQTSAIRSLARSAAFSRFMSTLGSQTGLGAKERWILQSMQTSSSTASQ
jgi:hypothetical protein